VGRSTAGRDPARGRDAEADAAFARQTVRFGMGRFPFGGRPVRGRPPRPSITSSKILPPLSRVRRRIRSKSAMVIPLFDVLRTGDTLSFNMRSRDVKVMVDHETQVK
jgi:hypothetical protein